MITRIGPLHADHAEPGAVTRGLFTSSATNPWLVMQMYRHAHLYPGCRVLDVGTGSGYGAALLTGLLGDEAVASIDIDPYITRVAAERLAVLGLKPRILTGDATTHLDWSGDRIVAMVGVPTIPASWLAALEEDSRLVANLAGTGIIVTARKLDDGSAWGMVEWDRAGFMVTRTGDDYEPEAPDLFDAAAEDTGDMHRGAYPVIDVVNSWELWSLLQITAPGIAHRYREDRDTGVRTALMAHSDGSWARAVGRRGEPAEVHQGGSRNLWDLLDQIRTDWLADGYLQLYGSEVRIEPDGVMHFSRGSWRATLTPR